MVASWMAVILLFTLSSRGATAVEYRWLARLFASVGLPGSAPGDCFHFLAYFVLALLATWAPGGRFLRLPQARALFFTVMGITFFSAFQEWAQGWTPDRCPSLFDFFVNCAGAGLSLILHRRGP